MGKVVNIMVDLNVYDMTGFLKSIQECLESSVDRLERTPLNNLGRSVCTYLAS